jgi:hypothetical protein
MRFGAAVFDNADGPNLDKHGTVLDLVQDEPALCAGAASGILDKTCARRSAGGRSAPRNGPLDLTKECIRIWDADKRHPKPDNISSVANTDQF